MTSAEKWEVSCRTAAGMRQTVTLWVHGDRLAVVAPLAYTLDRGELAVLRRAIVSATVSLSQLDTQ